MAATKTLILKVIANLLLAGCAGWLFITLAGMGDGVQGMIDGLRDLGDVNPASEVGSVTSDAVSAVDQDAVDQTESFIPLLNLFAIAPAALIFLMNAIIAACAYSTKAGDSAGCTKCLIALTIVFSLIGIIFYLIIGGAGLAMNSAQGEEAKEILYQPCTDYMADINAELAIAQQDIDDAQNQGASQSQLAQAQFELDEAQKAVNAIGKMCSSVIDIIDETQNFTFPGLGCTLACLILLILNICTCCHLGCCGKPKSAKSGGGVEMKGSAAV